jgi:hypothetical protein
MAVCVAEMPHRPMRRPYTSPYVRHGRERTGIGHGDDDNGGDGRTFSLEHERSLEVSGLWLRMRDQPRVEIVQVEVDDELRKIASERLAAPPRNVRRRFWAPMVGAGKP